jgi:hypothetical protein
MRVVFLDKPPYSSIMELLVVNLLAAYEELMTIVFRWKWHRPKQLFRGCDSSEKFTCSSVYYSCCIHSMSSARGY